MASPSPSTTSWDFEHPAGSLQAGALGGQIDVEKPQRGMRQLECQGNPLPGYLLAVAAETGSEPPRGGPPADLRWHAPLAEAYVRGDDLVASYSAAPAWPYDSQIYWRIEPIEKSRSALAALSVLVAVQTDLLDSHPHVCLASQLAVDQLLHVAVAADGQVSAQPLSGGGLHSFAPQPGGGGMLCRLPGERFSYAEIAPASDFRQIAAWSETDATARICWRLFSDFLEKGVIRKARIQAILLPRENDVELLAAWFQALRTRPLPLTT